MITAQQILRVVEPLVFARRKLGFAVLMLLTAGFAWQALQIKPDAGFDKQLPLDHPWIDTFVEYRDDFGGANQLLVAVVAKDGDIYNANFLNTLRQVHDAVFFLPGVDRSRVKSLFSADTRYTQIIEGGFTSGRVIPADYQATDSMHQSIKSNVATAGLVGRMVAVDHSGSLVTAELLDRHPTTGEKLDYVDMAAKLESEIRDAFETEQIGIHIVGFAKVVGDITDATLEVIGFFIIALVMTALLLWAYCGSFRLALLPLSCSVVAVIWEFGLLQIAGFGLDPFAILVPFLVLSVGVSHGIQFVNSWSQSIADAGEGNFCPYEASVEAFRKLAIPGTAALITDVIGFATIYLINIDIIQEMAINAAFGVAAIIVTNKVMMPILLTWVTVKDHRRFCSRIEKREAIANQIWAVIARICRPIPAAIAIAIAALCFGWALWKGQGLQIGDSQTGVPELRPDSRYNLDSALITERFGLGQDLLRVFFETETDGCINYEVVNRIEAFTWQMRNHPQIQFVISLPQLMTWANVGWNEGDPRFHTLPQNPQLLARNSRVVPTSAGLNNPSCSLMPVNLFLVDHRAETINQVMDSIQQWQAEQTDLAELPLQLHLAAGNVGIMAATNEVIAAEEKPILMWVYGAIILMCWLSFRSIAGVASVILPLSLVSMMAYGVMAVLGIGLKVATLPVAALAVGIGVDYGIYIYDTLRQHLEKGEEFELAYFHTLQSTGKAVIFTGLTLGLSVCTWLLSELQFQADMGVLLVFMFVANMFGAIFLLPAIARVIYALGGSKITSNSQQ